MKKYIKASDGSFVSFAKKAKTTFNPVTAAKAAGGSIKAASGDIKSSKKVSRGRNISASYAEYDEDVNLPGKIRRQIAELTGWDEDDIAFAFQQWIYDGGGEYDPDEMPKVFRDDIASDVERGEDIEAKYLGD